MAKYMVIQRNTGPSSHGNDFRDCRILLETDDLAEAFSEASERGYATHKNDYSGIRILKEVSVTPVEEE